MFIIQKNLNANNSLGLTRSLNNISITEEVKKKEKEAEYSLGGSLFKMNQKGIQCFQRSLPKKFVERLQKLEKRTFTEIRKKNQRLAACFKTCSQNRWPTTLELQKLKVSKVFKFYLIKKWGVT